MNRLPESPPPLSQFASLNSCPPSTLLDLITNELYILQKGMYTFSPWADLLNSAISYSTLSVPPSRTWRVLHLSQKNSLSRSFEYMGVLHEGHLTWTTLISSLPGSALRCCRCP